MTVFLKSITSGFFNSKIYTRNFASWKNFWYTFQMKYYLTLELQLQDLIVYLLRIFPWWLSKNICKNKYFKYLFEYFCMWFIFWQHAITECFVLGESMLVASVSRFRLRIHHFAVSIFTLLWIHLAFLVLSVFFHRNLFQACHS